MAGTKRARIKKGDQVQIMAGADYNIFDRNGVRTPLRGRVLDVDPVKRKIKVEGAGLVKKHQRGNPSSGRGGGIIEQERWIDISNVALIDPASGKPTRIRYSVGDDKSKTRVAVKSGQTI